MRRRTGLLGVSKTRTSNQSQRKPSRSGLKLWSTTRARSSSRDAVSMIVRVAAASRTRSCSRSRSWAWWIARPAWTAYISRTCRRSGPGRLPVLGQVDAEHAEQVAAGPVHRGVERVQRVPRVRYVEGLDVGDPAADDVLGQPVVRHEPQRPPLVGDANSSVNSASGIRRPRSASHADLVTGHRDGLDVAEVVDGVDHRDLEPEHVDHPVRDRLQDLGEVLHQVHARDEVVQAAQRPHLAQGVLGHLSSFQLLRRSVGAAPTFSSLDTESDASRPEVGSARPYPGSPTAR